MIRSIHSSVQVREAEERTMEPVLVTVIEALEEAVADKEAAVET